MPNPITSCAHCGATMPHACPSGTEQVGEPICCSCASRLRDDAMRVVNACSCEDDDARSLPSDPSWTELEDFAAEVAHGCGWEFEDEHAERFAFHGAVYWLASKYHSGQASELYAALSRCEYQPGPLETAASFAEADFEGGMLLETMRDALAEAHYHSEARQGPEVL